MGENLATDSWQMNIWRFTRAVILMKHFPALSNKAPRMPTDTKTETLLQICRKCSEQLALIVTISEQPAILASGI